MEITAQQLVAIAPNSAKHAAAYVNPLNDAMAKFGIDTPLRAAHFIGQLMHESGCLVYSHELASGDAYEGRADLGNTQPGDGRRFKGRGPIQITGRANYQHASIAMYGDERLLANPALLEQPEDGCAASAWFWHTHGLNVLADKNDEHGLCRRINGGLNGFADRSALTAMAKVVFGVV